MDSTSSNNPRVPDGSDEQGEANIEVSTVQPTPIEVVVEETHPPYTESFADPPDPAALEGSAYYVLETHRYVKLVIEYANMTLLLMKYHGLRIRRDEMASDGMDARAIDEALREEERQLRDRTHEYLNQAARFE